MKDYSLFDNLPDDRALAAQLASVLAGRKRRPVEVVIVGRERSRQSSTHPTEVVTCAIDTDPPRRVLLKFCPPELAPHSRWPGIQPTSYGLAYEARVYGDILDPLGLSTPRFYGHGVCERRTEWLAIEFCDEAHRVGRHRGLLSAARWIGLFHAAVGKIEWPPLESHDTGYYESATQAAAENPLLAAGDRQVISRLQRGFRGAVPELLDELTVAHGEYFTSNVLYAHGTIRVVDWESAVVAAGELDIACLIRGYPDEVQRGCIEAYAGSRWPDGEPKGFRCRLLLAGMYWVLRALGHSKKRAWKSEDYFAQLVKFASALGLK